jgi:hypothetical protein
LWSGHVAILVLFWPCDRWRIFWPCRMIGTRGLDDGSRMLLRGPRLVFLVSKGTPEQIWGL